MKRSPLKRGTKGLQRKTPLARGTKGLKRTGRLPPISQRKRTFERMVKPMHDDYKKLFPKCQYCNRRKGRDIHEIFSQGRREVARQHRSCILHLCGTCHPILQHAPKAMQLAVKAKADKFGFDLAEYNRLSPGEPVSLAEVDEYLTPFRPDKT